ncbi:MAG: hypothetical protein H8K03_03015 [Nitrospira sp.]
MSYSILRQGVLASVLLLSTGFLFGCTTVIKPVPPSEISIAEENQGLLFGTIHLTRNGKDQSTGLKWPGIMKWWVEDETHGKRFLISHIPIDGQFVMKLPTGSYRVTDISFESLRGIWHVLLPTTFTISSRECTSLGTWELEMHTGFFSGWITRHVSNEQQVDPEHFGNILQAKGCPTLVAPLESPVKRLVKLHFHTRGSSRF